MPTHSLAFAHRRRPETPLMHCEITAFHTCRCVSLLRSLPLFLSILVSLSPQHQVSPFTQISFHVIMVVQRNKPKHPRATKGTVQGIYFIWTLYDANKTIGPHLLVPRLLDLALQHLHICPQLLGGFGLELGLLVQSVCERTGHKSSFASVSLPLLGQTFGLIHTLRRSEARPLGMCKLHHRTFNNSKGLQITNNPTSL